MVRSLIKNRATARNCGLLVGGAVAALATSAASAAPVLTLDMRVADVSSGTVTGTRSANVAPGSVVTVNLYAVLHSADQDHTNDGFVSGQGSFVANSLVGNYRGDAVGATSTNTNNVQGFNGTASQSGYLLANSVGGQNIGRDVTYGVQVSDASQTPSQAAFVAVSSSFPAPTFATGAGPGDTELLIGQTKFTVTGNQASGSLSFIPHLKGNGTVTQKRNFDFVVDGTEYVVDALGNGVTQPVGGGTQTPITNAMDVAAPVTLASVPEPASLGLLGLASVGLLARRRRLA